jgi:hypothetical protein
LRLFSVLPGRWHGWPHQELRIVNSDDGNCGNLGAQIIVFWIPN